MKFNWFRKNKEERKMPYSTSFYGGPVLRFLGGTNAAAVTPETALGIPAFAAAVNLLSNTISTLPIHTYQPNGRGTDKVNHQVNKLLQLRPNEYMSSCTFFATLQKDLCLYGNAYAQIVRSVNGTIMELWPLDASAVTMVTADDGSLVYRYRSPKERIFKSKEVLHFKWSPQSCGLLGTSPIKQFAESLSIAILGQEAAQSYLDKGAFLSGVITSDKDLTKLSPQKMKEIKDAWHNHMQGSGVAGEVAVIQPGHDFKPISLNAQQLQFLESRKFQVAEVARFFNIPPHLIGDLERSTNNNIEQQSLEFVQYTLDPILCMYEKELTYKLLPTNTSMYIKFNVSGLLRADLQTRVDSYRKQIEVGAMTINEARALEERNPIDDPVGDMIFTPVNIQLSEFLVKKEELSIKSLEKEILLIDDKDQDNPEEGRHTEEDSPNINDPPTPKVPGLVYQLPMTLVNRSCLETILGKARTALNNIIEREHDDDVCRRKIDEFFITYKDYCERHYKPYVDLCKTLGVCGDTSDDVYLKVVNLITKNINQKDFREHIKKVL